MLPIQKIPQSNEDSIFSLNKSAKLSGTTFKVEIIVFSRYSHDSRN